MTSKCVCMLPQCPHVEGKVKRAYILQSCFSKHTHTHSNDTVLYLETQFHAISTGQLFHLDSSTVNLCVCVCVRACMHACARACMRMCACSCSRACPPCMYLFACLRAPHTERDTSSLFPAPQVYLKLKKLVAMVTLSFFFSVIMLIKNVKIN